MSKNLTRKGLAFGALVALTSTVIAGAPAYAGIDSGLVSLAPNAGTSYDVLAGSTFDLKSNVVGSLAGTADRNLKFLVVDSASKTKFDVDNDAQNTLTEVTLTQTVAKSGTTVTFTSTGHGLDVGDAVNVSTAATTGLAAGFYRVTSAADANTFTITAADSTALTGTPVVKKADTSDLDARGYISTADLGSPALIGTTAIEATAIGGVNTTNGRAANGNYVVDTNSNVSNVNRVLRLVSTDKTATVTAKVTAWVDDNDDNVIDSTEYQSPERTVRFLKNDDLTVTTSIVGPVLGASGIDATVSISPELNGQQVGDNGLVDASWTLQSSSVNTNTRVYNTTTKVWDVTMDLNSTDVVAVGNYSVRASVDGTAIGNTSTGTASTRVAADTKIEVAATADQQYLKNTDAGTTITSTVSLIRKGKTANAVITAYDADGVALGAGKSVTVAFSNATTTTDWTVNGVKVLDNAATGSKVYTTDAKGQVALAISSTEGLNADSIDVHASPENVAAVNNAANAEVRLTWATASYAIVDLNAPVNGTARNVTKLGSVTFDLFAGDQWNAPLSGAYRLYVTASGRTSAGSNVDFANGRATYTLTDAGLGSGSTITLASELQKQTSGTWAASTDATDFADVTVTTSDAPGSAIIATRSYTDGDDADSVATELDLSADAITAYNAETTQGAFTSPVTAAMDIATIALGAGSGIAVGDTVTVSGSGLFFGYYDASAASALRVSADSLTFVLDNASDVVAVYSNKYAKDSVVTVTSRGRSGTVKVTTDVAAPASARSATLTAPATAVAGSTFKVTAKLVDTFGNAVKVVTADTPNVKVAYAGPGIVFGTLPSETDASGELSFAVLTGATDSGTATVTLSYDINADGDYTDENEFVKTASVAVGASAAATAAIAGSTGKVYASVSNAAGKTVVIKINGVTKKTFAGTLAKKTVVVYSTAGAKNVSVFVGGVRVATKVVTIK